MCIVHLCNAWSFRKLEMKDLRVINQCNKRWALSQFATANKEATDVFETQNCNYCIFDTVHNQQLSKISVF